MILSDKIAGTPVGMSVQIFLLDRPFDTASSAFAVLKLCCASLPVSAASSPRREVPAATTG